MPPKIQKYHFKDVDQVEDTKIKSKTEFYWTYNFVGTRADV